MAAKVWQVEYVGDGEKASKALAFAEPTEGRTLRLLVIDDDTGATSWVASVPHREPSDYAAGGGGGHTWRFA